MSVRGELVKGSKEWKKEASDAVEENLTAIPQGFADYKKMDVSMVDPAKEQALINEFEQALDVWVKDTTLVHQLATSGKPEDLVKAQGMAENNSKLWWEMRDKLDGLEILMEDKSAASLKALDSQKSTNTTRQITMLIVGIIFALVMTLLIGASILKPIKQVTSLLKIWLRVKGISPNG